MVTWFAETVTLRTVHAQASKTNYPTKKTSPYSPGSTLERLMLLSNGHVYTVMSD